jgi:uncharacterized linocin/CFP29 family protein
VLDYILNGQGHGGVAAALLDHEMDPLWLKPIRGRDGRPYIIQNTTDPKTGAPKQKYVCVANTGMTAALTKEAWLHLDTRMVMAAKPRLRFVGDLRAAGLTYTIPNGFGKTVLQHQAMSDITDAEIAMDPYKETQADAPTLDLTNLPLPIIHKDFWFTNRDIAVSRNGGAPLDTTTAELAAKRVAELAEKLALGVAGSYKYGGGYVYGLTNFPSNMTKVLTNPSSDPDWTPGVTLNEVLAMKEQSQLAYHYGPWMLYVSPQWDKYLDADYSEAKGTNTLRERLKKIDGLQDVRTLDYLSGYKMILVQMAPEVIREVIGMEMMTVQWEPTPFRTNFKVMCIMVPQMRTDSNGLTGVVYGNVA